MAAEPHIAVIEFSESGVRRIAAGQRSAGSTGTRPIPAHRRAPKLSDDRPGSFTFRIYEAAVRGLRRSAISRPRIGWAERLFKTGCGHSNDRFASSRAVAESAGWPSAMWQRNRRPGHPRPANRRRLLTQIVSGHPRPRLTIGNKTNR